MRAKVNSIGLGGTTNLAVMAPIKPGFVPGFETITYLDRLRRLLRAMHSSRKNTRESELRAPVFPDSIGRFGIIHGFRYTIVPPHPATGGYYEPGISRLSLNVSFDGGWEPYMRVIYRDIGTLLDALFCHCDGYPGSQASFDTYCRWVRDNEFDAGIFYTDAATTPSDARYLTEVERLLRDSTDPLAAEDAVARYALETERQQIDRSIERALADPTTALALPLRGLKGLYRLTPYFPQNAGDDAGVLLRFAQSALKEFIAVLQEPKLQAHPSLPIVQKAFGAELDWLRQRPEVRPHGDRLRFADADLQSAILDRDDPVTHGAVALLGVRDAAKAVDAIAKLADRCGKPTDPAAVRCLVAFSYDGLAKLNVAPERLDMLPQEFAEGMEARCGLLGDVRGNHPDRWHRPVRHAAFGAQGVAALSTQGVAATPTRDQADRIDLTAVHVVVLLRLIDPDRRDADLHPRLRTEAEALERDTGLRLLAIEPTRSYREDGRADTRTREHFGFVDGLSQPVVVQPPADGERRPATGAGKPPGGDAVRPGELLLGYCNDRGDGPFPSEADDFLDNGSFLVMRKLRQHVDRLRKVVDASADAERLLGQMMGRTPDGAAPVALEKGAGPNDFAYATDPHGEACPFHSHIRRTNPRDGRAHQPRLLRRGMSYGPRFDSAPEAERGILFMAYCASIAEQFETVQRWIAGGNSTGVGSALADPFLAVPQPGEKRTFRYRDAAGKLARVDLGDQPFVELEWGLYLFVPSRPALRALGRFGKRPAALAFEAEAAAAPAAPGPLETWRRRLEDPDRNKAVWQTVREQHDGRCKAPPYGTLLGTFDRVIDVLQDDGRRFSVQGYGERMSMSIGLNHLGMDPKDGHDEQAPEINAAIERIDQKTAFDATHALVKRFLAQLPLLAQPEPMQRLAVDLVSMSEFVLSALCTEWIGLPEATTPPGQAPLMVTGGRVDGAGLPPRCPGHLLTASRFTFAPHPRPEVLADGPQQGRAILAAVEQLLDSKRPLGSVSDDIRNRMQKKDGRVDRDRLARNIAGLLLGFPPTVYGNFLRTMETWIDEKILWACQQTLAEVDDHVTDPYERARKALLGCLYDTMRGRPIPELLWRTPVVDGKAVHDTGERVVLGIASALTDPNVSPELMFGGSREEGPLHTPHACPGYHMGTGVLLGLIAGLLEAGTLRPTGSPVLLMLTPTPPLPRPTLPPSTAATSAPTASGQATAAAPATSGRSADSRR